MKGLFEKIIGGERIRMPKDFGIAFLEYQLDRATDIRALIYSSRKENISLRKHYKDAAQIKLLNKYIVRDQKKLLKLDKIITDLNLSLTKLKTK